MVTSEIRLANARHLLHTECGGVVAKFARKIGRADTQTNHLIGPNPTKNIGPKLARVIEEAFGKPLGWLDAVHDEYLSSDALEVAQAYAALPAGRKLVVRELIASWSSGEAANVVPLRDPKNQEEPQEH